MKNSEITKRKIIKESSILFNTKGYKSTSLSDITKATGLTKGAIYRHFENKEALENQSLDYMTEFIINTLRNKIRDKKDVFEKLNTFFSFFLTYVSTPFIKGGCPLLNVAIEVDETDSILRNKARYLLTTLRISIEKIIDNGKKHGQISNDLETKKCATIIIASLEGAIMMCNLEKNNTDLRYVTEHLTAYLLKYRI